MIRNGNLLSFSKLFLAFSLGVGTAVAATYNTFETIEAHRADQERTEQMLQEIRSDVKTLLGRSPQLYIPKTEPPRRGYGTPLPSPKGK